MTTQTSIGLPFIELHSVDSTNNYAMGLVHAGMAQSGTAVFAHEQTMGKGQREKHWLSTANENILLSIIIQPFSLPIQKQFLLSMAVAIGVHQYFRTHAEEETKIKWPNDLYWRDRKAGGILIENIVQGNEWKYAIIGIGININQTSFDGIKNDAVSLKQITGKQFNTIDEAKSLLSFVETELHKIMASPKEISNAYHLCLYKWKKHQRLKKGNRIFEATISGVTDEGLLIATHSVEEYFKIGEIEWII